MTIFCSPNLATASKKILLANLHYSLYGTNAPSCILGIQQKRLDLLSALREYAQFYSLPMQLITASAQNENENFPE
jgi:hypothetical protein